MAIDDDSQLPTPPDSDIYERRESRPDEEFNKRLLAKAAMAVDSKEENMRPPVIDVDSQSKPFDSTNVVDEALKKSSSAPQPQPPTQAQDAIKQIEEGNDAALHPFNSSELEDESKPKIGLRKRKESTDEEVGQLPKQNYHQDLRSETQTQRTAACSASVDDNENPFFQQMNDAEKYMSVGPVVEAYLVEDKGESGDVGHITVYEATPLEPELPWWKQRRSKVFMVINCVLITALAIGLGVSFSLSRHDNTATATQLAENHDESSSSDESSLVRSSGSSSSSKDA